MLKYNYITKCMSCGGARGVMECIAFGGHSLWEGNFMAFVYWKEGVSIRCYLYIGI